MTTTRYSIGIDLGTTYTAAAVFRDGRAGICLLGSRGAPVPSLVFLRDDQAVLTGEAAERRGSVEPTRLAREFKRRVGDTAPIMLGQAPYSAERLMAALLEQVVEAVATREGGEPAHVAVSHPANWGPYKIDLLRHALDLAGLRAVTLTTEPVAAAVHYASRAHVAPGSVVAVYDLGGGTFDAAVLRKTETGFEALGEPEGIERLGGIDFDEAVFAYVRDQLQGKLEELDGQDPAVRVAIGRLRRECVLAKEALSSDTETAIPVALPNAHTDIRLTRDEFEPMIAAAIGETIEALRRAIERAGVQPDDLDAVLLVGGSSQIPLVAQMVGNALGRPLAVDVHPKNSVALGASLVAARAAGTPEAAAPTPAPVPAAGDPAPVPEPRLPLPAPPPPEPVPPPGPPPRRLHDLEPATASPRGFRVALAAGAMVLAGAVTLGAYTLGSGGDGAGADAAGTSTTAPAPTTTATPTTAPPPRCDSASGRCATITGLRRDGDAYVADYEVAAFDPLIFEPGRQGTPEDHHVHFFFDTTDPADAGTNSPTPGRWTVWDRVAGRGELRFDAATVAEATDRGAAQLCVLVADASHGVEPDSGNCTDLPL